MINYEKRNEKLLELLNHIECDLSLILYDIDYDDLINNFDDLKERVIEVMKFIRKELSNY